MVEVSVIIPTKNEERYIGKVLDHISNQSFKDFEVIVSDGNSSDGTKTIVESKIPAFKKKGIDLIFISTKKKGVAETLVQRKPEENIFTFSIQMFTPTEISSDQLSAN